MVSIKKNIFYSSALTVTNYIFPLITYPYISRILGVTNIGICNFVDSLVNYFILVSMLGIGVVGIREVAKYHQNTDKLNKVFSSLFILNGLSTIIALVLLIISIYIVPKLYAYKELMYVGILKLVGNLFLIEWLYKGLEEFRFVTIRSIIVRCFYVISVFIFVKTDSDYSIYYLLTVSMIVVNAIINSTYARNFIQLRIKNVKFSVYLKPLFILGLYALLTSMYTSFNVTYLGFVSNDTEVGFYTTAIKLHSILLALFTAFTGVMLPRMSSLIANKQIAEFRLLLDKSVDILLSFSIPLVVFTIILAPDIVYMISGRGYEGAITPMRIVAPLIFIIGYEQILVIQILMPLQKDKSIFINSIIGACIGILLNILLVPLYQSTGSSIVWLLSEVGVLCLAQYYVRHFIKFRFPYVSLFKNCILYLPLSISIYWISNLSKLSSFETLCLSSIILLIYFLIVQIYIFKNQLLIRSVMRIVHRG